MGQEVSDVSCAEAREIVERLRGRHAELAPHGVGQPNNWCDRAQSRLREMEALVAQGRGSEAVDSGMCTDPGGGVVPTTRTAREMADFLREMTAVRCPAPVPLGVRRPEPIALGGTPVIGFGQGEALLIPAAAGSASPVAIALITSVVGAATGWTIEEIAKTVRGRRRRV